MGKPQAQLEFFANSYSMGNSAQLTLSDPPGLISSDLPDLICLDLTDPNIPTDSSDLMKSDPLDLGKIVDEELN